MKIKTTDHTKTVALSKDVSSFKRIAEDNLCGEDFSLQVFVYSLKCIFYQKSRLYLYSVLKSAINFGYQTQDIYHRQRDFFHSFCFHWEFKIVPGRNLESKSIQLRTKISSGKEHSITVRANIKSILHRFGLRRNQIKKRKLKRYIYFCLRLRCALRMEMHIHSWVILFKSQIQLSGADHLLFSFMS